MVRTQQELADAVGYSRVTVSKALAGHPSVQPATREKILSKARELGYRPNAAARAMRSGRCGAVAMVSGIHGGNTWLPLPLVRGLYDAMARRDTRFMFAEASLESLEDEGHIPRFLEELTVDGLLMNFTRRVPDRMLELLEHYNVPHVWLNLELEHDAVYPDDAHGGRLATEYLLNLGHERVGYLNASPPLHFSARGRRVGYEQAMRAAGREPRAWVSESPRPDLSERAGITRAMLNHPDRPTGVVCYGGHEVVRLAVAAAERGLTLGRDISVATLADEPIYGLDMYITRAEVPFDQVAEQALTMLHDKTGLENGGPRPAVAVPYGLLIEGASTAPPPPAI